MHDKEVVEIPAILAPIKVCQHLRHIRTVKSIVISTSYIFSQQRIKYAAHYETRTVFPVQKDGYMDIFVAVLMVVAAAGCFVAITLSDWIESRKRNSSRIEDAAGASADNG
jgi:hypothetical protein